MSTEQEEILSLSPTLSSLSTSYDVFFPSWKQQAFSCGFYLFISGRFTTVIRWVLANCTGEVSDLDAQLDGNGSCEPSKGDFVSELYNIFSSKISNKELEM